MSYDILQPIRLRYFLSAGERQVDLKIIKTLLMRLKINQRWRTVRLFK